MRWDVITLPSVLASCLVALGISPLTAFAGGGPGDLPALEGATSVYPASWSSDGRYLAVTAWDRAGLLVLDTATGERRVASQDRGSGFHPVWLGQDVFFKEVIRDPKGPMAMRIVRYDALRGLRSILHESGALLGDPSTSLISGRVAFTDGATLLVHERTASGGLKLVASIALPAYCNLAELDPSGQHAAFDHPDGRIGVVRLTDHTIRWTNAPRGASHPQWSSDGQTLTVQGPGAAFALIDVASGQLRSTITGTDPRWVASSPAIVYDRTDIRDYQVTGADLWLFDSTVGREIALTDSAGHERYPVPSPRGNTLAFVDTQSGTLSLASLSGTSITDLRSVVVYARDLPSVPPAFYDAGDTVSVYVPYMHQRWDTPDAFNGASSCGPTTALMTIQRYGRLPDIDMTCTWSGSGVVAPHNCPWAYYVPYRYYYSGYMYSTWGSAAACAAVQGVHGFVNHDTTCAYTGAMGDAMVLLHNQHGVTSWYATTALDTVTDEINAGYALYTLISYPAGHFIVIRGYLPGGALLINDPYGDYNLNATVTWGSSSNGNAVVYDWPGHNTGHAELVVDNLFGARGLLWDAQLKDLHFPVTMVGGTVASAYFDFKNLGAMTWTADTAFVGTASPLNRASPFFDEDTWVASDRPAGVDFDVANNEQGRFTFNLRAPVVSDTTHYTEHWRLVTDGGSWFGPAATELVFTITVTPGGTVTTDNIPPVAEAGDDQSVTVGDHVTLDGSGSIDPDGEVVFWRWTTPNGNLFGEQAVWTPTSIGTAIIALVVTDDRGDSDTDYVTVAVTEGLALNQPPVAEAGPDQTVTEGDVVTLDGSASHDPDGAVVSWRWEVPGRVLFGQKADFIASTVGLRQVRLTVTDDGGQSATDMVNIDVLASTDTNTDQSKQCAVCPKAGSGGCNQTAPASLLPLLIAALFGACYLRRSRGAARSTSDRARA